MGLRTPLSSFAHHVIIATLHGLTDNIALLEGRRQLREDVNEKWWKDYYNVIIKFYLPSK